MRWCLILFWILCSFVVDFSVKLFYLGVCVGCLVSWILMIVVFIVSFSMILVFSI